MPKNIKTAIFDEHDIPERRNFHKNLVKIINHYRMVFLMLCGVKQDFYLSIKLDH